MGAYALAVCGCDAYLWTIDPLNLIGKNQLPRDTGHVKSEIAQFTFPRFPQGPIYQSARKGRWAAGWTARQLSRQGFKPESAVVVRHADH